MLFYHCFIAQAILKALTAGTMWSCPLSGLSLLVEPYVYNLLFNSELLCYLDWSIYSFSVVPIAIRMYSPLYPLLTKS